MHTLYQKTAPPPPKKLYMGVSTMSRYIYHMGTVHKKARKGCWLVPLELLCGV